MLAFHDILALSETTLVFFTLLGLLMISSEHCFYAGASFALASLCHFTASPLIVITLVYELLKIRRKKESSNEGSPMMILSFLIGYGIIFIPYLLFLQVQTGEWYYVFKWLATNPVFPVYGLNIKLIFLVAGVIMIVPTFIVLAQHVKRGMEDPLMFFSLSGLLAYGVLFTVKTPPIFGAERYFMLMSISLSLILSITLPVLMKRCRRIRLPHLMSLALIPFILLTLILAPRFIYYQGSVETTFNVADWLATGYQGGTIVCEMPPITYRLINKWHIPAQGMLGAHHIPTDPILRNQWLRDKDVRWIVFTIKDFDFTNRIFPEFFDGRDHPPFYVGHSWNWIIVYQVTW